MDNKYLAYVRSINAVRIFLNIMGFKLDDFNDINVFSKIKIRDNDGKIVGKLSFDNEHVMVKVKNNSLSIKAICNVSNNPTFLSHKINFDLKQKNKVNINGELEFSAVDHEKYDRKCVCMPSIVCTLPTGSLVKLKLLHDGKLFNLNYSCLDYTESIEVTNGYDNFIRHVIENDYYDKNKKKHHYKLYSGVFNSPEFSGNGGKLHLILTESLDGENIISKEDYIDKITSDNFSDLLMQKSVLMYRLDNTMRERINQVRNLLMINDSYLFDNLLGVCLGDYSDLELEALFNINKNSIIYQDGSNNLIDAYFGDNAFKNKGNGKKKIFK